MSDGYTRAILRAQEDVDTLGADLEDLHRGAREFRETLRQFLGSFGSTVEADGQLLLERFDATFFGDGRCPVVLTSGQRCQRRADHPRGYHIADRKAP